MDYVRPRIKNGMASEPGLRAFQQVEWGPRRTGGLADRTSLGGRDSLPGDEHRPARTAAGQGKRGPGCRTTAWGVCASLRAAALILATRRCRCGTTTCGHWGICVRRGRWRGIRCFSKAWPGRVARQYVGGAGVTPLTPDPSPAGREGARRNDRASFDRLRMSGVGWRWGFHPHPNPPPSRARG